jgi:hypothetical protein
MRPISGFRAIRFPRGDPFHHFRIAVGEEPARHRIRGRDPLHVFSVRPKIEKS